MNPTIAIDVSVFSEDDSFNSILEENLFLVKTLAKVETLKIEPLAAKRQSGAATAVADGIEFLVPLKGIIDVAAERSRLNKDQIKTSKQIESARKKLGNAKFLANAPKEVILKEQAKLEEAQLREIKISDALARLEEVERS